jgi:hypothetical protein
VPVPLLATSAAVLREYRYGMSAAIRPLLFWVGDKDVGGARIVSRRDALGQAGYEFLLGSDPNQAPRRINRWGFVREQTAKWWFRAEGPSTRRSRASAGPAVIPPGGG